MLKKIFAVTLILCLFLTGCTSNSSEEIPTTMNPVLWLHAEQEESSPEVLSKLSEGATEVTGFQPHPPPDDGGGSAVVVDKYGYTWFLCA